MERSRDRAAHPAGARTSSDQHDLALELAHTPSLHTIVGDVGSAAAAERFVAEVLARFGRIDVLVNNSAAPHGADRRFLWDMPEEAWNLVLDVALAGAHRLHRPSRGHFACLAVFVASEQSDHITGQASNVDGGTVMH